MFYEIYEHFPELVQTHFKGRNLQKHAFLSGFDVQNLRIEINHRK